MYQNFETNLSMTSLEHVQNHISLTWGHSNMKTKLFRKSVMLTKKADNKKAAPNCRSPLFYLFSKPSKGRFTQSATREAGIRAPGALRRPPA